MLLTHLLLGRLLPACIQEYVNLLPLPIRIGFAKRRPRAKTTYNSRIFFNFRDFGISVHCSRSNPMIASGVSWRSGTRVVPIQMLSAQWPSSLPLLRRMLQAILDVVGHLPAVPWKSRRYCAGIWRGYFRSMCVGLPMVRFGRLFATTKTYSGQQAHADAMSGSFVTRVD